MNDFENTNISHNFIQKGLLNTKLSKNITTIKEAFGNSSDLIIRETLIGKLKEQSIAIIHTDGLADKTVISDFIVEPLLSDLMETSETTINELNQHLKNYCLTVGHVNDIVDFTALFSAILNGDTVILLDGLAKGIATSTKSSKDRAVTEPSTESVIRGPRESFTETLRTNTALIRRKIKSPNLWIKSRIIGEVTQTDVAVMYINGIAKRKNCTRSF